MKPTRAALYARCSTGHQDVGLQVDALRRLADTRGWSPVEVYGQMSATNQSGTLGARREEYDYSFEGWLLHEDRDVASPDAESTTFSYDPAGNRLTRARTAAASSDLTTYTYAGGNRLVSIQKDADPAASLVWNEQLAPRQEPDPACHRATSERTRRSRSVLGEREPAVSAPVAARF